MKRGNLAVVVLLICFLLGTSSPTGAEGKVVDMDFRSADIIDVFRVLGEISGLNVLADHSVQGEVTFFLKSIPVMEAIDLVARTSGYHYEVVGNTIVIASPQRLQEEFADEQLAVIKLQYLTVEEVQDIISVIQEDVELAVDSKGRTIVIKGPVEQIERVRRLISKVDTQGPLQLDFVQAPVQDVLRQLARAGGYSLVIGPEVEGELTVVLDDMDIPAAVELVVQTLNLSYEITEEGLIRVWKPAEKPAADADVSSGNEVSTAVRVSGIVRRGGEQLAIVELNGESRVMREGDRVGNLVLIEIGSGKVTFTQGENAVTCLVGGTAP